MASNVCDITLLFASVADTAYDVIGPTDGVPNDIEMDDALVSDIDKLVGILGEAIVVADAYVADDVPYEFVAVRPTVYSVYAVRSVIVYSDNDPANVCETVVPEVGTAVNVYVVIVCAGGVNCTLIVVLDTAVMINPSGISGKLVVVSDMVEVGDVPELLVADSTNVYAVPNNKPLTVKGEPSV